MFEFSQEVISVFSERSDGNMSLNHGDVSMSLENRNNFLGKFKINPAYLVCAKQVHSSNIVCVRETDRGKGAFNYETAIEATDALVTDQPQMALAVFTADCLPIFLYDQERSVIGLVHAGWRSTCEHIVKNTVKMMQDNFFINPKRLQVYFGPAIRSCCYEVEEKMNRYFSYGLQKRDGTYYLDIIEVNKAQLFDAGIIKYNIIDSGICTSCQNHRFFSFRKEGKSCGRMISVIMLR
ncbi:MAG: peptidoglycan editing factor PgeF [Candidatus Omnitrophica bacterium]|nr:peptidoglycan editing factor PgeF [Candidatus Omnitrophota bacterium]